MSAKGSKIKNLIQEYLLEEGLLRENLPDPGSKLDFGVVFVFPPGQEKQRMSVFKPKKKDLIVLVIQTQISKDNITALKSQGSKREMQFFLNLRKFFLFKEVFFKIDTQQYRYEISDQFFLEKNGLISILFLS